VFPFARKASAVNVIVLVSKTVSIGAPFVNESEEPIPIVVIALSALLSIIIAYFYDSKEDLDKMQKVESGTESIHAPDAESKNAQEQIMSETGKGKSGV